MNAQHSSHIMRVGRTTLKYIINPDNRWHLYSLTPILVILMPRCRFNRFLQPCNVEWNSASFRPQPTWTETEWDPIYDAVLAASCCGPLDVLSYWIPKSKHEIGPRLAKPVSHSASWKLILATASFYVACNGGKEAPMNDYGNKAMHARRAWVRHLAISHSRIRVRLEYDPCASTRRHLPFREIFIACNNLAELPCWASLLNVIRICREPDHLRKPIVRLRELPIFCMSDKQSWAAQRTVKNHWTGFSDCRSLVDNRRIQINGLMAVIVTGAGRVFQTISRKINSRV